MSETQPKRNRFKKLGAELRTPCKCEFCWSFFYVPRHNPQFLHVVEALADSAAVLLSLAIKDAKDYDERQMNLVFDRLNRIKAGSRKIIMELPAHDIARCEFRKSKRERCHMPLDEQGHCPDHGDQASGDIGDWF